jgi:hypothetical protein
MTTRNLLRFQNCFISTHTFEVLNTSYVRNGEKTVHHRAVQSCHNSTPI